MKRFLTLLFAVLLIGGLAYAPVINPHFITNYLEVYQKNYAPGVVIKNASVVNSAYPSLSFIDATGIFTMPMYIDGYGNIIAGMEAGGYGYPGTSLTIWGDNIFMGPESGKYCGGANYGASGRALIGIGTWTLKYANGNDSVALGEQSLSTTVSPNYVTALGPFTQNGAASSISVNVGAANLVGFNTFGMSGAAVAGVNLGIGQYVYFITYILNGVETVASSPTFVVTTAGNQAVNLTGITKAQYMPYTCTARKVYRNKIGNLASFYLLTTIGDNTTTVYSDTTADDSLGAEYTSPDTVFLFGANISSMFRKTMVLGGHTYGGDQYVADVYFNQMYGGDAATADVTLHATGGYQSNAGGADFTIAPGQGTGTAAGGSFNVQVAPAGTTGSVWNPLTTALSVDSKQTVKSGQTSVSLADNAVHDTKVTSFYGLLIVKDTTTGVSAVYRLDGGTVPVAVSAHANFSTTQGTDNKINVYFSTTYKVENCNTAASVVKCTFMGTLD